MWQEIVEMVRAGYDGFNRRDIEAALAPLHPSIEWWPAADEPITGPYRGHDGYRSSLRDQRSHFLVLGTEFREQFQRILTESVVTCPGLPTLSCTSVFFFQSIDGRLVFGRVESECTPA